MKKSLLLVLVCFIVTGCSIDSPEVDDSPSDSLEGTWQVLRFENDVDHSVMSAPEGEEITVSFTASDFTGIHGANNFGGKYQVTDRNHLSVMEFFDSKAGESDAEETFYAATKKGFNSQSLSYEVSQEMLWVKYESLKYIVLKKK